MKKGLLVFVMCAFSASASAICRIGPSYDACAAAESAELHRRMEKIHDDTMRYYYESEREEQANRAAEAAEAQARALQEIADQQQRQANTLHQLNLLESTSLY